MGCKSCVNLKISPETTYLIYYQAVINLTIFPVLNVSGIFAFINTK